MLKIAIVDGDEESVDRLKKIMTQFGRAHGADMFFNVFHSGVDFVSGYTADYDFVFMEINLPHMNGLKTAKAMRELDKTVPLVFVTGSAAHAIHGYDVGAIQFLIKPLEYDTFSTKLGKYLERAKERDGSFMIVDSRENKRKVLYSDIYYITVSGRYVSLHTKSESIEMNVSMKEMENILRDKGFVRGDNSSMVNMTHVTSINPEGAIVNGELIPCSRHRRKALISAFKDGESR